MNLKKVLKNLKLSEETISTILGALVVVVIGVLVFNYFRSVNRPENVSAKPTPTQSVEFKSTQGLENNSPTNTSTVHKVVKGETLWQISMKYFSSGYNWVDIAKANNLTNPNKLIVGQELTIPKAEVKNPVAQNTAPNEKLGAPITSDSYTVVRGDNLWNIAVRAYQDGFRWTEIAKANHLANPRLIHPGNVLTIPRK